MHLHDPNEMYRFHLVDGMGDCADYIATVRDAINDVLRASDDPRLKRYRCNDGPDYLEIEGLPDILFLRQYADAMIAPRVTGWLEIDGGFQIEWRASLVRHQEYSVGGTDYQLLTYEVEEA